MQYFYPNSNDKLTIATVRNLDPYPGYWEQSECYAFANVKQLFEEKNFDYMLDVGAGTGRLSIAFSPYFKEITALEPDKSRLSKIKNYADLQNITNIHCMQTLLEEASFPDQSFDVILCSHVIQHIAPEQVSVIFEKMYALLKTGGMLVLTTNHSRSSRDIFTFSAFREGVLEECSITVHDFNDLVINNKGYLPIHHFSIQNLKKYFYNYEVQEIKVFHETRFGNGADARLFRDESINRTFLKKYFGRYILVSAQKKS